MINTWCAFYSVISVIIQALITVIFSAKSPVVLFILWVFRNSLTVCSEIVHSVRHSHLCVCAVPAHLQQSQEQESSAAAGVRPAPALQAVLLHEAIPLLRAPPWENAEIVSADTTQVHMPLQIRSCVASCTSYCTWKE